MAEEPSAQQPESIYEWDVARIGDEAPTYVYEVTRENIADYCRAVRYENPIYTNDGAAKEAGLPGAIAPPTMMYTYAPQRRSAVIEAQGYIAPEQSETSPQHPFRLNQSPLPRGLRAARGHHHQRHTHLRQNRAPEQQVHHVPRVSHQPAR